MSFVLDASACLAWIFNEPGQARVHQLLHEEDCLISSVNAAEVVTRLAQLGQPEAVLRQVIGQLQARCLPFDAAQATEAGLLRQSTRHLGLSLGDRACLALALRENAVAVTADLAWLPLAAPLGLSIEYIRADSH